MPEMAGMRVMCSCARHTPKRSHTQTTRLMLCSFVQIVTEAERKRRAKVGADGTVAAEVESKMKQVSFKASSSNDRLVKVSGFFMRYCLSGTGPQVLWDMQQGGHHQSPSPSFCARTSWHPPLPCACAGAAPPGPLAQ